MHTHINYPDKGSYKKPGVPGLKRWRFLGISQNTKKCENIFIHLSELLAFLKKIKRRPGMFLSSLKASKVVLSLILCMYILIDFINNYLVDPYESLLYT